MNTAFHTLLLKTFYAQRNRVRPSMNALGLSPGQPKILLRLGEKNGCRQKDLAEFCEIEPATVSKLLTGMETAGLIERTALTDDKRSGCVTLTEKGQRLREEAEARFSAIEEEAFRGFTDREKEETARYLHRIYHNLTGRALD